MSWSGRALLLLAAVSSISACASARAEKARRAAAAHFQCPVEQVTYTPAPHYSEPALYSGCGKEEGVLVHCIEEFGMAGFASSCKTLRFSEAVAQASFTTGCPKERIATTWMRPNLGVEACGQRMTFAPSLSGWILNTASAAPPGVAHAGR